MSDDELTPREIQVLKFIRDLVHRGRSPSIREIQEHLRYGSPRSAAVVVDSLIRKRRLDRRADGRLRIIKDVPEDNTRARTISVPLVGTAACGRPLLAEENIEAMIPVSTTLAKRGGRYFLLRAKGDSMDQGGIHDGDLVLVRQQRTANNGDIVVALIDDEATIKQFYRQGNVVVLRPKSSSLGHQPIILDRDFSIQGRVIATIPTLT